MLFCVRSVGPPPELVRQREAKWINIIGQWERILLKKTSKVCLIKCNGGQLLHKGDSFVFTEHILTQQENHGCE